MSGELAHVEPAAERAPALAGGPDYETLWRVAQRCASSAMVPKAIRGHPEEAFAVMIYGDELGLGPMAALRSIYMIEGQPTCSAQLMRGLILAGGHLLQWREVRSDRVALYGRRRDGSDALVTWTMDDARRAKLTSKGNWGTYPRAMLAARATSELARLLFADVLHGIAYTPEEVGAVGPLAAIDVDYSPTYEGEVLEAGDGLIDPDDRLEAEAGEVPDGHAE